MDTVSIDLTTDERTTIIEALRYFAQDLRENEDGAEGHFFTGRETLQSDEIEALAVRLETRR